MQIAIDHHASTMRMPSENHLVITVDRAGTPWRIFITVNYGLP